MKRKFWNWVRNEGGSDMERTLFLNGEISDETWYGDEVTPKLFKDELNAGQGSITVWINSPGGDVFAAAQIYNMLRDYKGALGMFFFTMPGPAWILARQELSRSISTSTEHLRALLSSTSSSARTPR